MTKEFVFQILGWIKDNWIWVFILIFGTYYALKWVIKVLRFLHQNSRAKDLIYLKITLPRSDSKMDTEKRTEKDFKELLFFLLQ